MKLLKIEENQGHFLNADETYSPIDQINKEDLLRMVNSILADEGEIEEYDEQKLKHQAHQVVYKSIYRNLQSLKDRKQEFTDQSERLYLPEYERYRNDASQQETEGDG